MTVEIALVFIVIAVALYLFASQLLPLDLTAIGVMVTLMVIPVLGDSDWLRSHGIDLVEAFPTVGEGLSGLSNPATVTVLAMFILSSGVQRSGLIHVLGQRLLPFVGNSEVRLLLLVAGLVGLLSGIVNNTAAVAVAIPFVLEVSRRASIPASRVLIPVSFFGMLGGMLTLVGTSTSILADSLLAGSPEFDGRIGMFEFTHLGLIVLVTGVVYFLLVGRRLLPTSDPVSLMSEEEHYLVELGIPEGSPAIGEPAEDAGAIAGTGVEVLKLVRNDAGHVREAPTMLLEAGDVVLIRATLRQVMDLIAAEDIDVLSEIDERRTARTSGTLVRALLRNRHRFNGASAASIGFFARYRGRLIGLEAEQMRARRLADEPLHVGEICLIEASPSGVTWMRRHPDLVLLSEVEDVYDRRSMLIAGLIILLVVAVAALTPLPIVVTSLLGVVALAIGGGLTSDDLYSGVQWDVIFLLAGVIPLGIAMTKSGGAAWLADLLARGASGWHPIVVLIVMYAITTLLTELVSNNASVVILVPVAITLATELELPVFALVLAVMFAASTSFLSPIGYQTNAMIFGTGLYRFTDFAKVGAPLNALLMIVTSLAIWILWM